MSRIDEALRRMRKAEDEPVSVDDHQPLFQPAWQISEGAAPPPRNGHAAHEAAGVTPAPAVVGPPVRRSGAAVGFASSWRDRLASGAQGHPGLVEQFRRLAAQLHHAQQANGIRSVMVTSAKAGDGKTLTAVNLALVLAESYRGNVLLMDADLRRPSIPSVVDLGEGSGLSEALRAATEQKLALVPLAPTLTLLPAGQPIANSLEALTSPRMKQILDEAVTRFDWVILDAPPVGLTADARLLTQMVDGSLFVVRAGETQYDEVQKAIDALGRDQILGVVLNGVDEGLTGEYYYHAASGAETER